MLHIAPKLDLPLDAVTETFAILAKRRSGKSNAAVVMAEEMFDNGLQWVAIDPKGDWWGVKSAGDGASPGLAVVVFGGLHGDVPLEPTGGKLVADLIIEERLTCVLDVSEMTKADQRRFLIDFADRLYRRNTEPLHVFCEEADEYIPQRVMGENAKLVGAFETLVKRGGFRGIGVTLVTQRSASLNKDVLTQIETLIPMRTPSPQDRKAILAWVDVHASGSEAVSELPSLADGEAWVFSPQWLHTLVKIKFRRRRTFDSGATPKVGAKRKTPTNLAEVDLAAIKEAMAETIEKAQAEDPKHLRAEISRLKRELDRARAETPQPELIEVPAVADDVLDRLDVAVEAVRVIGQQVVEALGSVKGMKRSQPPVQSATTRAYINSAKKEPKANRPAADRPVGQALSGGQASLSGAQRKILTALAQHGPKDKISLAILTGYSHKGGGFNNPLGSLRSAGYVSPANTTPIEITEAGLDALGDYEPLPMGRALLDWWLPQLSGAERKIVSALDQHGPMEKVDLAAAAGYEPSGGGFNNPLGHLRTLGIITPAKVSPIALAPEMED